MENSMNRFALIAVTGFMALALTACGEHGNSKPVPTEATTEATTEQQQGVAPEQQQGVAPEAAPVAPEAAPQ